MTATKIEWATDVWNPTRGCSRVSEGCRYCYAERQAARFSDPGMFAHGFASRRVGRAFGTSWTGRVELIESKLTEPLRWRRPRGRVFVNSMSDLFHESLPDESIDRVFAVMALAPQHTFLVLTKRAERMREYLGRTEDEQDDRDEAVFDAAYELGTATNRVPDRSVWDVRYGRGGSALDWPLPNVWLGVSVEDQPTADARIPELLATPAAVRFVSYEPALGPVDPTWLRTREGYTNALAGWYSDDFESSGVPRDTVPSLDWLIVGGESGPNARPCDVRWIRSVVKQCKAAQIPAFVKQLGARPYVMPYRGSGRAYTAEEALDPDGEAVEELGKVLGCMRALALRHHKGGDMAEWPEDLRVREVPE